LRDFFHPAILLKIVRAGPRESGAEILLAFSISVLNRLLINGWSCAVLVVIKSLSIVFCHPTVLSLRSEVC